MRMLKGQGLTLWQLRDILRVNNKIGILVSNDDDGDDVNDDDNNKKNKQGYNWTKNTGMNMCQNQ